MAIERSETLYPKNSTTVDTGTGIDVRLLSSTNGATNDVTQSAQYTHANDNVERTFDPATANVTNTNNAGTTLFKTGWALRLAEDMTPVDDTNCNSTLPAGTLTFNAVMIPTITGNLPLTSNLAPTFRASLWRYNVSTDTGTLIAAGNSDVSVTWNCNTTSNETGVAKSITLTVTVAASVEFTANEVLLLQVGFNTNNVPNPLTGTMTVSMAMRVDATGTNVTLASGQHLLQVCTLSASTVGKGLSTYSKGYPDLVLEDTPLIYLRLGESSGTNAVDSSGNGRNGTYQSSPTLGQTGALENDPNTAVDLNGTTQAITTTYNPFTIGSTRTFEIWANNDTTNTNDAFFGNSVTLNNGNFLIRRIANTNTVEWYINYTGTLGATGSWTNAWPGSGSGQYVHMVLTVDDTANTSELFINSVSQGSQAFASTNTSWNATPGNLYIGVYLNSGADWFDGKLDEAAVYGSVLSAARIKAHYLAYRRTKVDVTMSRSATGKGVATESRAVSASRNFDLVGKGVATTVRAAGIPRTAVGKGNATFAKAVIAAKSFSLEGKGTTTRQLDPSVSRTAVGKGTVTSAKAVTASKSFDVVGKGVATESRTVQAARTFSLVGKGVVTRTLAGSIPRTATGKGEIAASKAVVASKQFSIVGKGEATQNRAVVLSRNAVGKGVVTEIHPVQAYRTFNLAGKGDVLMTGDNASTITIPINEIPTEGGGGGTTVIIRPTIIFDD